MADPIVDHGFNNGDHGRALTDGLAAASTALVAAGVRGPLRFEARGIRQVVPWPADAPGVIEALGGLAALLAQLAGGAGPYR